MIYYTEVSDVSATTSITENKIIPCETWTLDISISILLL